MLTGHTSGRMPDAVKDQDMFKRCVKLMNDSRGATAIEYGLIAALIAVAAIAAMRSTGSKLKGTFTNVSNAL